MTSPAHTSSQPPKDESIDNTASLLDKQIDDAIKTDNWEKITATVTTVVHTNTTKIVNSYDEQINT